MSVLDWLSIAAAVAVMVWFVSIVVAKDRDKERFEEDDARTYFDRHGHWPDETPADAVARAERAALSERAARMHQD